MSKEVFLICIEVKRILDELKKKKAGRQSNWALDRFVADLAEIYNRATGKKPARTYDHYGPGIGGQLFSLIKMCLQRLNLGSQWTDNSIDHSIKKYIKYFTFLYKNSSIKTNHFTMVKTPQ